MIIGTIAALTKFAGPVEAWLPWGLLALGAVAAAAFLPLTIIIVERQDH